MEGSRGKKLMTAKAYFTIPHGIVVDVCQIFQASGKNCKFVCLSTVAKASGVSDIHVYRGIVTHTVVAEQE